MNRVIYELNLSASFYNIDFFAHPLISNMPPVPKTWMHSKCSYFVPSHLQLYVVTMYMKAINRANRETSGAKW